MKKTFCAVAALGATIFLGASQAGAVSTETDILLQLLQDKGVITSTDAQSFKTAIDQKMAEEAKSDPEHYHSVRGMAKRLDKLEKAASGRSEEGGLMNKVQVSGVLEVNATASSVDKKNAADEDSSDIALATAEVDIDAAINEHVSAHLALLYEEDGTNNGGSGIVVDEGIINLDGGDKMPLYLRAGKMYLPFGYFDSHFITDPLTLTLGRTKDTAAIAGYHNSVFDINVGVFKGEVKDVNDDSKIDSFVSSATYTMPESTISGLALMTGMSYTSNLQASDTLQGEATGTVNDIVSGYSAFLHLEFLENYTFDAEYLSATDGFKDAGVGFLATDDDKPAAWNFELAARVMPKLEVAMRYGGSSEAGGYDDTEINMPQSQIGGALLYDFLADTSITFEYLHGEYKNETEDDLATLQLAVEF